MASLLLLLQKPYADHLPSDTTASLHLKEAKTNRSLQSISVTDHSKSLLIETTASLSSQTTSSKFMKSKIFAEDKTYVVKKKLHTQIKQMTT